MENVKDIYTKNYQTLLREIKDLHKWREVSVSCVGRLKSMAGISVESQSKSHCAF